MAPACPRISMAIHRKKNSLRALHGLIEAICLFSILSFPSGCSEWHSRGDPADMPLFAHPGSCRKCHGQNRDRPPADWKIDGSPQDAVCTAEGCHSGMDGGGTFVHGPVAVGACSSCHIPHTSNHPSLLRAPKDALCASCHGSLQTCPAAREPSSASCSSCHHVHQGENAFLLRERNAASGNPEIVIPTPPPGPGPGTP